MSYQSTTPNFDLPQWVYSDPPQMNDFNTAFANIDEKAIPNDEKGAANGVATLNSSGKLAQMPTAADVGAVPTTRTVNGKALSSDISLTASDVGAVPSTGGSFTGTVNLTNANVSGTLSVSGTLNGIGLNNYLRQEIPLISETPALNDIDNGFGFAYEAATNGSGLNGIYLSAAGKTSNNYVLQFLGQYNGSSWLAYRTKNGDISSWNPWHKVLTDNINATISAQHGYSGSALPQIYGNGSVLQLSWANNSRVGVVLGSGAFRDAGDGNINLGASNHRFATVFAKTGSINTSDRNEKNTIADIAPEQAEKLIMGLKPSTFKFNDGTSGRTHWGIISQDIEELLPQIGMTDMDFAGFIKSPKTEDYYEDVSETVTDEETGEEKTVTRKELKTRVIEGEYVYALRYSEFIAPLICMVQKQQKQIENLERRLSALENKEEAK